MRAFYEAFWADAPQDPEPYEWERRRALLLGEAQPGDRVLDLGCGAGPLPRACCEERRSASRSPRRRRAARGRTSPAPTCACCEPDGSLPVGHGEFDLVWCSETLEHIPDVGATAGRDPPRPAPRRARADHRALPRPRAGRARSRSPASRRTSTRSASTCASSRAARSPRALEFDRVRRDGPRATARSLVARAVRAPSASQRVAATARAARPRRDALRAIRGRGSTRPGTRAARPSGP